MFPVFKYVCVFVCVYVCVYVCVCMCVCVCVLLLDNFNSRKFGSYKNAIFYKII